MGSDSVKPKYTPQVTMFGNLLMRIRFDIGNGDVNGFDRIHEMANKLNIRHSLLTKIEFGNALIDSKFIERLITAYPLAKKYESKLYAARKASNEAFEQRNKQQGVC